MRDDDEHADEREDADNDGDSPAEVGRSRVWILDQARREWGQLVLWPCWGRGGLRVGKEAPERHEKGEAELEEPERDDE